MQVFVTGASGWIGGAVVPALLAAGHEVEGLARSDRSAEVVAGRGAAVRRGTLADLDELRAGAAAADAVVHLGYQHDFSHMAEAADVDRRAVETFGDALAGTDRPLVVAGGVLGLTPGRIATEDDVADPATHPRSATGAAVLGLADRGVRSVLARFAPTVHGPGDAGFTAVLVDLARRTGFAGYVGDGESRWPAVHRLDAGELVRLAVESAPAGSAVHAVADEGIATREIAAAIGAALGVPTRSVDAEQVEAHFGWIGSFFAMDSVASNARTRELLGWTPTHPGLLADIAAGAYGDVTPHSTSGG